MGGYYGLAVLVGVASVLTSCRCDENCRGRDGQAGQAGIPGRDGLSGVKGQKGEPAVMTGGPVDAAALLRLKGETGNRGPPGLMGLKGYRGDLGTIGDLGNRGLPGPDGRNVDQGTDSSQQARSAFSVIRTDPSYPSYNRPVTYQTSVVNIRDDFDLVTGHFTCRVPGVYYFTFNSVAKVSMCLRIASTTALSQPGFCDYNRNYDQVLTGGVVLQLTAGQKVWLESFKDRQADSEARDTNEKQITFSGFLIFSGSD